MAFSRVVIAFSKRASLFCQIPALKIPNDEKSSGCTMPAVTVCPPPIERPQIDRDLFVRKRRSIKGQVARSAGYFDAAREGP